VYVDFSALYYLTYPVEEARDIRLYLEAAPERVLYGSDASPFSGTIGWEETGWIAAQKGRLSLGIALTGMIHDGEITVDRAKQIAHMVLRDNARRLYGL
jgi:predicted TIM-barrel fold metal-dependent hydrolase